MPEICSREEWPVIRAESSRVQANESVWVYGSARHTVDLLIVGEPLNLCELMICLQRFVQRHRVSHRRSVIVLNAHKPSSFLKVLNAKLDRAVDIPMEDEGRLSLPVFEIGASAVLALQTSIRYELNN